MSPRPASPFLILLLAGAATALGAEWLRFQAGWALAAAPAVVGGVATLTAVARAYRARRRWRRARAWYVGGEAPLLEQADLELGEERVRVTTATPSSLRTGTGDATRSVLGRPSTEVGDDPDRVPSDATRNAAHGDGEHAPADRPAVRRDGASPATGAPVGRGRGER